MLLLNFISNEDRQNIQYTTIKTLNYKAGALYSLNQNHECINTLFSQMLQIDEGGYGKGNYKNLYNLALSFRKIDENENALLYFNQSLLYLNTRKLNHKNSPYSLMEEFEEPILTVNEDLVDLEESKVFQGIANIYKIFGKNDKAIEINQGIKKKYEKDIESYKNELSISNDKKKNDILTLDHSVKNNLSMIYAEMGNYEKAFEEIRFVDDPKNDKYIRSSWIDTKGYIYYKIGEFDEAVSYFDKAIQNSPYDKDLWFHKGNCFLKVKN